MEDYYIIITPLGYMQYWTLKPLAVHSQNRLKQDTGKPLSELLKEGYKCVKCNLLIK